LAVALAALVWAYRFYQRKPLWYPPTVLENKYYVDEAYDRMFVRSIKGLSTQVLWQIFDVKIIDGMVNGTATLAKACARGLRHIQTGLVRSYAVMILLGALLIIGYFIFAGS
jgi:NADH-quinone oxidoreductase subunit L